MKRTLRVIAVIVALASLAALTLSGCAANSQSGSSSSGSLVTLDAEGVVMVPLDYNAGTGYEWQCTLSGDEGALFIASEDDEDLAKDQDIDGGPLRHWVTMRAAKPGNAVLTCELVRPWEKDTKPAETQVYSFTVDSNLQIQFNAADSTYQNEPEWGSNS